MLEKKELNLEEIQDQENSKILEEVIDHKDNINKFSKNRDFVKTFRMTNDVEH